MDIGILFAIGALLSWGIGDFLIQHSTRRIGTWESLLLITIVGAIGLFPFVLSSLYTLASLPEVILLTVSASVLLFAALLDFEALRQGKIAVIEPLLALELPVSAILSFLVFQEILSLIQSVLIGMLFMGILLVSTQRFSKQSFERGILFALSGALLMGGANFLIGFSSRVTDPLLTNWFVNVFHVIVCTVYLSYRGTLRTVITRVRREPLLLGAMCILDNAAWIFFAISMTLIPIGLAVGISESYIALAALLGVIVNKERLLPHQIGGIVLALASVIILSFL